MRDRQRDSDSLAHAVMDVQQAWTATALALAGALGIPHLLDWISLRTQQTLRKSRQH